MILARLLLLAAANAGEPDAPEAPRDDAPPSELGPLPLPDVRPRPSRRPPAPRFSTTGFRAVLPAGGASVGTRIALVDDFDGPFLGEVTLRGQLAWQSFGLAVETVGTGGVSSRWSSAGLGNTTVDLRGLFGRGATHALGLRVVLPFGSDRGAHDQVAWWGTVPAATVPTWAVALAYEGGVEHWVWHVHVGGAVENQFQLYPDFDLLLATVQPVAERWHVVGEVEILTGHSPAHLRALARRELGKGWTVDGGVAIPIPAMFQDPTLQLLGRVERHW